MGPEIVEASVNLLELANQLNLAPGSAEAIQVRGTIQDKAPLPPTEEEMIRTVLEARPDVVAYRLGIQSAQANVKLQKANRLQDVGITTPARGDLVPLDYPTVKRFRGRLRELMNLGGVGREAAS